MSQTIGELLALVAALCGAISSVLYNRLGKTVSSDVLACVRMEIAAPIMCLYALLVDGFAITSLSSHSLTFMVVSGVIGFFITDVFLFRAYVSWGARETMVVMCLAPVLSTVMSYVLFEETLNIRQIFGSLCSLAGVVVMTLGESNKGKGLISKGAIIALFAAFFQSFSDITAKYALSGTPWVTTAGIRAVGGMVAWLLYRAVRRKSYTAGIAIVRRPKFLGLLTINLIIGTVIGTTVAMGALKYAPAGIVTSLKQVSPIFILIYEFVFVHKRLSVTDVLGTLISVFGVFLLF